MALDIGNLMLQLRPGQPIDLGNGGGGRSMQRESLRLQREEFEALKKYREQQLRQNQEAEAGEMRRAELGLQKQRETDAAAAQAKTEEAKRAWAAEFDKRRQSGDFEGMDALIPQMHALGGDVERLGDDEDGLPTYRIIQDRATEAEQEGARAAQAAPYGANESAVQSLDRLGALGYPGLERGSLEDPAISEPISTLDAYEKALAASQHAEETGSPLRGPDQADLMGSVPKDVIDTGAMHQQGLRRLDPALGALQQSYPDAYQDSVGASNEAARRLGMPAAEAFKTAKELRAGADDATAKELEHERKLATPEDPLKVRTQLQGLSKEGYKRAEDAFKSRGLEKVYTTRKSAEMVLKLLNNETSADDKAIAFNLTNLLGSVGAQSNNDLKAALGLDSMSTIGQVKEAIHGVIKGGYSDERRKVLSAIVQNSIDIDDENMLGYLDAVDQALGSPEADAEEKRGWREFRRIIPKEYLDAHDEEKRELGDPMFDEAPLEPETPERPARGARAEPRAADSRPLAKDEEFMDEFYAAAAEADLDPEAILPLIAAESGGDPKVQNREGSSARGLIQFLDKTAQRYGFENSEEFAQLSRTEQVPFIMQYLKDAGVTEDHDRGDIYVAISAPAALNEDDDFEVYKKGTDEYRKNLSWDLDGDGVITRGELYRWGWGERKGGKGAESPERAASATEPEEVETELDAEVNDILR